MKIAVFCASANGIGGNFLKDAQYLGEQIGKLNWQLIYGGTDQGLMKEVALATIEHGGQVTGIIPECIYRQGVAAKYLDNLIITPDMKERKQLLREHATAFIALPGGWGTLEEITEVITLKQLGEHQKPIVFVNTDGFYNEFMMFIDAIQQKGFVSSAYDKPYQVVDNAEEAILYLNNYVVEKIENKY